MEFVAAALGIISAGASLFGGLSGKSSAEKAGKEEAKLEQVVTSAKLVDLKKEEEVLRGQTIAAAAGAGVKTDIGSPLTILAEQRAEFARESRTVAQAGATRAAQATTRGRMVGQQSAFSGFAQATSTAANVFSIMAK